MQRLQETTESLSRWIREVPDFPVDGVLFRDITPLLLHPPALKAAVNAFVTAFAGAGIERVAAIESRGFILGAPLAVELACGFVPIRKLGKLPRRTVSRSYSLEYGTNHLEMHVDAVEPGQRVLVVDDVLATGGTARAAVDLVREVGGTVVSTAFLIELCELGGRQPLGGTPVFSLLTC
jgi:adenine phosphoribosyltransferase